MTPPRPANHHAIDLLVVPPGTVSAVVVIAVAELLVRVTLEEFLRDEGKAALVRGVVVACPAVSASDIVVIALTFGHVKILV